MGDERSFWDNESEEDLFEEIDPAQGWETVYPLLHTLAGRSPREFFDRAAALEALAASARPGFSSRDLDEILYWLAEPARAETLRALRLGGWLEHDPAGGDALTAAGRWTCDALASLHRRLRESGLAPRPARDIHPVVTEAGGHLELAASLTPSRIVRILMSKSLDELAAIGREALLPILPPPPLLTTEAVAQAAELQALRERQGERTVPWSEPAEAARAAGAAAVPPEVERLLADLSGIGEPTPLDRVIPSGDAGESFLRASLLALVGTRLPQEGTEGIAGRLGALPLRVVTAGDGWPETLAGPPLSRLTAGAVLPARA